MTNYYYNLSMKTIEEIVTENLIRLRKQNNLKQSDVAEKVNYTNKAVSRWEKGEVIPSLKVLGELANFYNVPYTYFFEEHEDENTKNTNSLTTNMYIATILSMVLIVWTVATLTCLALNIYANIEYPLVFMWAVPATAIAVDLCLKHWFKHKYYIVTASACLWTIILASYIQFIEQNIWTVFILGIPVQLTIVLLHIIRKIKNLKPKVKRK